MKPHRHLDFIALPASRLPESLEEVHLKMALSSGQRRHLISAYATASHLLRQMEEAGSEGRSPTGVGSPLTPLLPEEVEAICEPLRSLEAELREQAAVLAPVELAEFERPQSRHNTRVWMSNLLEKLRAAVDSLEPRQMRKYGASTEADNSALAALHTGLAARVQAARCALDTKS